MTRFVQQGDKFIITGPGAEPPPVIEPLPPGNYVVSYHDKIGYYLSKGDDFTLPPKIYGSLTHQRDRIISTFKDREASTGVLAAGEKGSGKSLLAKDISITLAKEGIPTLLVNAAFSGDDFSQFLTKITQPAIVLFDEFEKVYKDEMGRQDGLLTLLDGVFPTKKLFFLTCNDKYRVNSHMKNRPGRIFYFLEFAGLEKAFIEEYAKDNLREALHGFIPKLVSLGSSFEAFNFDMLKAVCEEMNRYCEEPKDALRMLNIRPERIVACRYNVKLMIDGKEIPKKQMRTTSTEMDPNRAFKLSVNFGFPISEKMREKIAEEARDSVGSDAPNDEYERALKHYLSMAETRSLVFTQDDFLRPDAASRALIYRKNTEGHDSSRNDFDNVIADNDPLEASDWKEATLFLTKNERPSMETLNPYDYL